MKSVDKMCYKVENVDRAFSSYEELLSYLESQPVRKISHRLVVLFYGIAPVEFYRVVFALGRPILRYIKFDLS